MNYWSSAWVINMKSDKGTKQYVVQLQQTSCCGTYYRLLVNGQEIQEHGLKLCNCYHSSSGRSYEWDEYGHHFHLMYDGFAVTKGNQQPKYFRLFVDGVDVDTGLEFTAYWRRKAKILLIVGSVFIFIFALVYILAIVLFIHFNVPLVHLASMVGVTVLLGFGVAFVVIALIILKKYIKPRSGDVQTTQPSRVIWRTFTAIFVLFLRKMRTL